MNIKYILKYTGKTEEIFLKSQKTVGHSKYTKILIEGFPDYEEEGVERKLLEFMGGNFPNWILQY